MITQHHNNQNTTRLPVLSHSTLSVLLWVGGVILCLLLAMLGVFALEARTKTVLYDVLRDSGIEWATLQVNGTNVTIGGSAPSEANRSRALVVVRQHMQTGKIFDHIVLLDKSKSNLPVALWLELSYNNSVPPLLTMLGFIPQNTPLLPIVQELNNAMPSLTIRDLTAMAQRSKEQTWDEALRFAVAFLHDTQQNSKIRIHNNKIHVDVIAHNQSEQFVVQRNFNKRPIPQGFQGVLNIMSPPPLARFRFELTLQNAKASITACAADNTNTQNRIIKAAAMVGIREKIACPIYVGAPSPQWGDVVVNLIEKTARTTYASVSIYGTHIKIKIHPTIKIGQLDALNDYLDKQLDPAFTYDVAFSALQSDNAPPSFQFVAKRTTDNKVQLRGYFVSEQSKQASQRVVHALFATKDVYSFATIDDRLPRTWSMRVLTGIESLSMLADGEVVIEPNTLTITGRTGNTNTKDNIEKLLQRQLGAESNYHIAVSYDQSLDPVLQKSSEPIVLDTRECVAVLNLIVINDPLHFESGRAVLTDKSNSVLDAIAQKLKECPHAAIEISGHTDNRGSEKMNLQLSQLRAEQVLRALIDRYVVVDYIRAKGYGEAQPIATNSTEKGRKANRRIEFRALEDNLTAKTNQPFISKEAR